MAEICIGQRVIAIKLSKYGKVVAVQGNSALVRLDSPSGIGCGFNNHWWIDCGDLLFELI